MRVSALAGSVDDALIQPYSGHESRQSLEIYSRVALAKTQDQYDAVIDQFPSDRYWVAASLTAPQQRTSTTDAASDPAPARQASITIGSC
jgi:hypothetical protein